MPIPMLRGGEDSAGHAHFMPTEPTKSAGLEQLHHLTGRPCVDLREGAFTGLFPQRSLHARSPPCRVNTGDEQKRTPPVAGLPDTMIAFQPAETFVHLSLVVARLRHRNGIDRCPSSGEERTWRGRPPN